MNSASLMVDTIRFVAVAVRVIIGTSESVARKCRPKFIFSVANGRDN